MRTTKEIRRKIEELEELALKENDQYNYSEVQKIAWQVDALKWVIYSVGELP